MTMTKENNTALWITIVILFVILFFGSFGMMNFGSYGGCPMCGFLSGNYGFSFMWVFMLAIWILLIVVLVLGIIWLIRQLQTPTRK